MFNTILFITGKKGCGKTTIANKVQEALALAGRRIIVVAPMGGFTVPGARQLSQDPEDLLFECSHSKGRNLLLEPESIESAEALFRFVWEVGNCWLFVDEVHLYLAPGAPSSLLRIVQFGRHRGISLCGITMRPALVRKDLCANSDIRLLFCTDEPNDSLYLRKLCAVDPERLRSLGLGQFILQKNT